MAEEESDLELGSFKQQLAGLFGAGASDASGLHSKSFCASFCQLVEEHTGRWQVPLPQLQLLRSALCDFVRGTASFPSDCEHVRYTLSSLALSVFELLLFFGKDEFPEDPLKDILDSFQECHSSLVRYQNVYLLQVRQIIKDGGPWASPVLQGILREMEQPQEEVDRYLSSEVSVFFELRVRYLLACERIQEAMALSQKCSQHPTAGRQLYFKQAYLSCLCKTSQQERLFKELSDIDGKDAVEILCLAENEEKDEVLLELSRGFLLQQLSSGDMYCLWDLVFIWCQVCLRVKASKHDFLDECKLMISSATNIKAIFPFMKVVLAEDLGKDGLAFCIELCASALQTDLKNDPPTKTLIYKTIAYLLPNDLEICRACALLVFFHERSVDAYKTVFLLYTHPDQEYHVDSSPVGNHMRFELIQILKKDLFFDPEFWSLLNIKTHCLKLMSDKVARAALCEIMEEDKWVPNCCVKGHCKCHTEPERTVVTQVVVAAAVDVESQESMMEENQVRPPTDEGSSNSIPLPKKRGRKPGSKIVKNLDACPVRRSFRQLDLAQNHSRQLTGRHQRFLTRHTENKNLKRRGRKPRWLLEELAAQAENSAPRQGKKRGRKPKQLNILKDILVDRPVIEITMDFSYPDNEVDLPADTQCLPCSRTTLTTESSLDVASKMACQGTPDRTSNSLPQLESGKSATTWMEKAIAAAEEFVFETAHDVASVKFHTYAKVPEVEGVGISSLTDNGDMGVRSAAKHEGPFQAPVPAQNPTEPVFTSVSPALPQISVPAPEDSVGAFEASVLEKYSLQNLPLVAPVEDNTVPKGVVSTPDKSTVCLPKHETTISVADTVRTHERHPESSDVISFPQKTANNITDHSNLIEKGPEKAADAPHLPDGALRISTNTTPTLAPQTITQRTVDTSASHEKLTDGQEKAPSASRDFLDPPVNVSEVASRPETPAHLMKEKPQEQVAHQTAEGGTPRTRRVETNHTAPATAPAPDVSFLHRCRLCGEECRSSFLLQHAFWHYREERKCMFCPCFSYTYGPLCHFKKHIKSLRVDDRRVEKKAEGLTETSARPDLHGVVPKKAKPGLEQIKSRLLLRLKARSNAQAQVEAENSSGTNGRPVKQRFKKQPASSPELKEEEDEEMAKKQTDEVNVPRKKIRYMTRGLLKRSEPRGRLMRGRLARKAKTGKTMVGGEVVLKESSVPRVNGVIKKKRKVNHLEESLTAENEQAESKEKTESSESKHLSDATGVETGSVNVPKEKLKPGIKRKSVALKQSENAKALKKRKVKNGHNKETEADGQPKETNQESAVDEATDATQMENGTAARSKEASGLVAKKKRNAYVRCPVDLCTFSSRAGLVLSHVLFHHPADTQALEFFYNLANKKCLFCARRIWTSQHFFDHVVSHRGHLKHSCYHVDCEQRFKTRLQLMDHMVNDHRPLKAVCCFPGCTVLSAKPQFLYSHERAHYRVVQTTPKKEQTAPPSETAVDETSLAPEDVQTAQQAQLTEAPQQQSSAKVEVEEPLKLNRGSVSYPSKSSKLLNGHSIHRQGSHIKSQPGASKEQESNLGKVTIKPFVRPPPSAYLDETYISMPKRWKGPQVMSPYYRNTAATATAVATTPVISHAKKTCCPRCSVTFNSEEELQAHRGKCTSLFGFDSDDESAS